MNRSLHGRATSKHMIWPYDNTVYQHQIKAIRHQNMYHVNTVYLTRYHTGILTSRWHLLGKLTRRSTSHFRGNHFVRVICHTAAPILRNLTVYGSLCLNQFTQKSVNVPHYQSSSYNCTTSVLEHVSQCQVHWKGNVEFPQLGGHIAKIRTDAQTLLLPTNILHGETVVLIEIGDVVLAAELHAVGDPNRCVIYVEEALPAWMDILWTLFPFTGRRAEGGRQWRVKEKKKQRKKWSSVAFIRGLTYAHNYLNFSW